MPSTWKQQSGKAIATRSRRKPRRPKPLDFTTEMLDDAAPASGSPAQGNTIKLLQEIVDILRGRAAVYERNHLAAGNPDAPPDSDSLRDLADENLTHARWLAERIAELGGTATPGSRRTDPGAAQGVPADGTSLQEADRMFEDTMIDRFGCLLTLVGESDLTTKFLIEDILFDELEHSKERRAG